jgi:alkylation response protein AidB-like acyl-CoA dehydrogenase
MSFEVPEHVRPIRARVRQFIEEKIYPVEPILDRRGDADAAALLRRLMGEAKAAGLWALGHPKEIGGQGLPFLDYVYVNEVVGRSEHAMVALGTHSLQDSIMLNRMRRWIGAIATRCRWSPARCLELRHDRARRRQLRSDALQTTAGRRRPLGDQRSQWSPPAPT